MLSIRVKLQFTWNRPSKICGRQPLKYLKGYGFLKHQILSSCHFFKGGLPQILLSPFLNTLSQIQLM